MLRATAVGDVWGIGRKIGPRLVEAGIRTVYDLVHADIATLRRQFSVVLEKTVLELSGTPCLAVDDVPSPNQQIMCSRSFGEPVTDLAELTGIVSQFASRVAEKARSQHSAAGAIQVFIATSPFRKRDAQHSPSVTLPLVRPTSDTAALVKAAVRALEGMYRPAFNYLKAGVMLIDLRPQDQHQAEFDLFADSERGATEAQERSRLMGALDALNRRFGRGAVAMASAVHQRDNNRHAAKQERRSPRYTARLDEIPTVKA